MNSSSTDGSSDLLDRWIAENNDKFETNFRNHFEGTDTPGSTKNAGLRLVQTGHVAFMDCGLSFPKDWLERQWNYLQEHDLEMVSGMVWLEPTGLIDTCSIAQTYGYKRLRPCVPSSLIKLSVFEKTGHFMENRRAGYDLGWQVLLHKRGVKRGFNEDVRVSYIGTNFAPGLWTMFRKSIVYNAPTVGMPYYHVPYYYVLLAIVFLVVLWLKPVAALVLFGLYLLGRGYLIPFKKSRGITIILDRPLAIVGLPLTGLVMDAGRFLGILQGMWFHHVLRKYPRQ